MKKEKILEQIDELKQKIEVLEKKVNSLEFEGIKKSVRQMPEYEEKYFFLIAAVVSITNFGKKPKQIYSALILATALKPNKKR